MAVFFTSKQTWPTITNDIRVSVYGVTDTTTPIASLQLNAPHLDQQFDFPGLPRINFIYKIFETEINGSTIIAQRGQATFVPANDELVYKSPVDIHIGFTEIEGAEPAVWPAGTNTVTIPGWIGYELILGRMSAYPLRKGVDYSWNAMTGQLILLGDGDLFNYDEWFHAEFETIVRESSGGTGGGTTTAGGGFSEILVVTANTTLTESDIGKKILIAPSGNYLEITLPDFTSLLANKITYFEMVDSAAKCAAIKPFSGQTISYKGSLSVLHICPNESFELYKRVVTTGSYQWRIQNAEGNFLNVGEIITWDAGAYNCTILDGNNRDYQQYARLYAYIVSLGAQALAYASWSGANILNRMKFSLKDTASNNFRVPDLITTPVYLRPPSTGLQASDYVAQQILQHQHALASNISTGKSVFPWGYYHALVDHIGKFTGEGSYYPDMSSRAMQFSVATGLWSIVDGNDNNPNSRITNFYVRI